VMRRVADILFGPAPFDRLRSFEYALPQPVRVREIVHGPARTAAANRLLPKRERSVRARSATYRSPASASSASRRRRWRSRRALRPNGRNPPLTSRHDNLTKCRRTVPSRLRARSTHGLSASERPRRRDLRDLNPAVTSHSRMFGRTFRAALRANM
jgi:hypothetical protein